MDKVWLVTGSASGLGRNIAEAVLESGDRLVATARDPRRLDDLVNKFGERVRAVSLDVADESAAFPIHCQSSVSRRSVGFTLICNWLMPSIRIMRAPLFREAHVFVPRPSGNPTMHHRCVQRDGRG
jgi:short chain dehydrogenase